MYKLNHQLVNKRLTAKDCEGFLALNNFPGQRRLHEPKARYYSELLLAGKLRPVEIAFAACPDGNRYLMNGQHVCQGCIWAGREMLAVVSYYKCETWRDAWELFATFDVHASRTQSQLMGAARGLFTNEALREVPLRLLGVCGSALAILKSGTPQFSQCSTCDKAEKIRMVEKHAAEILWLASIPEYDFLCRVGVVTAIIAAYRKNPKKADAFWRKVGAGLFMEKTDPAKRTYDFINAGCVANANTTSTHSRSSHFITFCVCVSWWNSFVTGDVRNSVKVASMKEAPEVMG